MATNTIITVGRQYGSGGRYVARLLAEKLLLLDGKTAEDIRKHETTSG